MSLRKQKIHKPEFNVQVVLENLQGKAQSEIARQYGIHQQLITNWKRHLLSEAPKIFSSKARDNQENQKIEEKMRQGLEQRENPFQIKRSKSR